MRLRTHISIFATGFYPKPDEEENSRFFALFAVSIGIPDQKGKSDQCRGIVPGRE
jgi:hypothetical protein